MLIPFWQIPWPQAGIGVRTAQDPLSMQRSIANAVHSVDPDIALAQPETLEQIRSETMSDEKFTLILFGTFAAVALLLAVLGIYGVMAFSVAQRSHELALRMALGATRGRLVGMVVREGVILASVGLGLGLIGAYFVGRAMQSMLFNVHPLDVLAFVSVGLVLMAAAVLACYWPARRAASIHPDAGAADGVKQPVAAVAKNRPLRLLWNSSACETTATVCTLYGVGRSCSAWGSGDAVLNRGEEHYAEVCHRAGDSGRGSADEGSAAGDFAEIVWSAARAGAAGAVGGELRDG